MGRARGNAMAVLAAVGATGTFVVASRTLPRGAALVGGAILVAGRPHPAEL